MLCKDCFYKPVASYSVNNFFFFCKVEVLPLNEIQVIEFSLWGIMLLVLYLKKSLPNLDPRFSPMSSRSFIVLYYTFRFMIHLGYFL